jgi:Ca2+-binding RTX toxin-like protein
MPVKFIPVRGATTYSFGGGGNDISVLSEDDTTSYTVSLGGGNDTALLGAGNDTVFGGSGSDTLIGGRGNDTLYGASGSANYTNILYGDAASLSGTAVAGNDTLLGGQNATNTLYGDAGTIIGTARAGHDTLIAGDGPAAGMVTQGNDILVSGTGNDVLWGDTAFADGARLASGGADTFRFLLNNGQDTVMDFRVTDGDIIDLAAFGFADFAALADNITQANGNTVINLAGAGGGSITLAGVTDILTAESFKLA